MVSICPRKRDAASVSWSCYYDPLRKVYLADVFTSNWINDTAQNGYGNETLGSQ